MYKKYLIIGLLILSFVAGIVYTNFLSANPLPVAIAKEYKVLEFKNIAIGQRENRMERDINDHAADGWRVVSISSAV